MQETEPTRNRWLRLTLSLSAKLNILLLGAMVVIFALLGYLNVRLHRQHLEQNTLLSAERVSDIIKHSTTEYMLRNDQEGLYHSIRMMAGEPGMEKIRIFDQEGRITYTTDSAEQNHVVDKTAEACYACHAQSQPLARLNRPDRFRIYRNAAGARVLGIITPIENQPACSNAACHAHPAEQQILGVLDTNLSLAKADVQLAESSRRMIAYTGCALLLIALLSWIFVWQVVGRPVKALERGTERLAAGDLGYQIEVHSNDEIGQLASSFNGMSRQLHAEHNENLAWTRTLEQRVEQKTGNSSAPTSMLCTPRRWPPSARWPRCSRMRSTIRFRASSLMPSCCVSGLAAKTCLGKRCPATTRAASANRKSSTLSTLSPPRPGAAAIWSRICSLFPAPRL
jgi:two-component system, NtrC family, sensor kinase